MPAAANIAMFLIGLALTAIGIALTVKAEFARWALSVGRARIWNALLGGERAYKLTRYFFGPVSTIFGLLCVLGSFFLQHPAQ